MSEPAVCAVAAGVGGVGATRLALEFGATLARDNRSVAVVDAAYATQGLGMAIETGRGTDLTTVVTEDRPLAAATTGVDIDAPGRLAVASARAPFERLSRAKTSECGRRLAERLASAAREYDHVLVDVPPVAANQSVAAVAAADRVVLVVPDARRGVDAVTQSRERFDDIDTEIHAVVANRAGDAPRVDPADAAVPVAASSTLADAPTCLDDDEFGAALVEAAGPALGVDLDVAVDTEESSSLLDSF